ncbi:MAG TPA: PKD domain-containing protein [Phycisphaerae bacterium]|nr:PKD domain-containing protein [Phycisphaerae bacterium]
MRNEAPRSCNRTRVHRRGLTLALLTAWSLAGAVPALAADRRYTVILAYPPKTFAALEEGPQFDNPAMVDAQYFDHNPNNNIYSLAEWWNEISYGAVTVSGSTFGWLKLPWPLQPVDSDDEDEDVNSPADHINLNFSGHYQYGSGEDYAENPMPERRFCFDTMCDGIPIDYNGDNPLEAPFLGGPADAFAGSADPEEEEEDCNCCGTTPQDWGCQDFNTGGGSGTQDTLCGTSDDGQVLEDPTPCPADTCCLAGIGCIALCDNAFSCAPGQITRPECAVRHGEIIESDGTPECYPGCAVCGWDDRINSLGNQARAANIPSLPLYDGIYTPGERYRDIYEEDGRYNALYEPMQDADINAECDPLDLTASDYFDVDDDGERDRPEPFEDFIVRWDAFAFSGAGEWVTVTEHYIRANYPENPNWDVKDEIYGFLTSLGYACTNVELPLEEQTDLVGVYFAEEMFRLRDLGDFNDQGLFVLDNVAVANWSNVDEMVWRTGNGVYDPPERFRDTRNPEDNDEETNRISTKMQHVVDSGDPWTTRVPLPGTYGAFDSVDWYATFWRARYGTDPPPWAKGNTGRNSPNLIPFDPAEPHPGYVNPENADEKRRFRGGINSPGGGGQPDDSLNQEQPLAGPIEPDTNIGFYDGWVEHDDLASSRYHAFGDQRLGEATSPNSFDIAGQDIGPHNPTQAPFPDDITAAAGPLALHIHGENGLDAGNLLVLEWMTWRNDMDQRLDPGDPNSPRLYELSAQQAGWTPGIAWDWEAGNPGRTTHPYAGPASGFGQNVDSDPAPDGCGFRDYNLDGLIDQGEVRPAGSANYSTDSIFGTPNDGTSSVYPFNRRRLLEDCIEVLDYSTDFDLFRDTNSLARVAQVRGWSNNGIISNVREGLVSGIVLFPPDSFADGAGGAAGLFPSAPSFYPIHTQDRPPNLPSIGVIGEGNPGQHPPAADARPLPSQTSALYYNQDLWFHDLPAKIDRDMPCDGDCAPYAIKYSAHEYGHSWEGYPDLYDYEVYQPNPVNVRQPVGTWGVMASGGHSGHPVHPVADLKSEYSEWIQLVDLRTTLTPGVEREITFPNAETSKNATYYYFANPLVIPDPTQPRKSQARERFYFWRAGFPGAGFFDRFMPGQGLLILHTDVVGNDEGVPPQQGDPFTWNIIQADGLYQLDAGINGGDAGDPFPGNTGTTVWSYDTFPWAHSRWHGGAFSGLDITEINQSATGTRVKFRWTPTVVPSLTFVDPPGGSTVGNVYTIAYQAYDLYAGTTLQFYYIRDSKAFDTNDAPTHNGFPVATPPNHSRGKETPRILESGTMPWDLTLNTDQSDHPAAGVADGRYFIYCKLVPGVGEEGSSEPWIGDVLPARTNKTNGKLTSPATPSAGPIVNHATSKLEGWTVTCLDNGTTWSVQGSVSKQHPNALTNQNYSSSRGEVQFRVRSEQDLGLPSPKPFAKGDQFTFVTTGLTAYSEGLTVKNQTVLDNPIAEIDASPEVGPPPLTVVFDASRSDPNGAPSLTFTWNFGDGSSPASGAEVEHTFKRPGTFSVTLTATNPATGAFGTDEIPIRVLNQGPTAVIEYTIQTPDGTFPYDVRFSGSKSEDPEDLPLQYLWTFDDRRNSTSTEMDPPEHRYFPEDPDHLTWYCAEVTLEVTDSVGDTNVARLDDPPLTPGLKLPTVAFTATPSTVAVKKEVQFKAEGLTIEPNDESAVSYSWNFGDSSSATGLNTTHTYTTVGTYRVTFTLRYDTNCRPGFSATKQVRVVEAVDSPDAPEARFTYTVDPESWVSYTFDASGSEDPQDGTTGLTYEWDFDDGTAVQSTTNPVIPHQFQKTGAFRVQLTVLDADGNAGVFADDVIVVPPSDDGDGQNTAPVADFTPEPASGPGPLTVDFTSTSSDPNGDVLSYDWDFDDGDSSNVVNPKHTFDHPGSYDVTLTVTDPGGLSDSISRVVEVTQRSNHNPVARIATAPAVVNAAGELILDATISTDADGDSLTYTWQVFVDDLDLTFATPLTGPTLVVRFRSTADQCIDVADPCLPPGTYDFFVTVDDGFGGKSVSSAMRVTFNPTDTGGQPGGEPGNPTPDGDGVVITGRSSGGAGRGLCGLGVLMPTLLTAMALAATMVARRRRW